MTVTIAAPPLVVERPSRAELRQREWELEQGLDVARALQHRLEMLGRPELVAWCVRLRGELSAELVTIEALRR